MKSLPIGTYLGSQKEAISYKNVIISKTIYSQKEDQHWHCHQNPFFAYFLKGSNCEYRESKQIQCLPGTLLFYKPNEPHCNKQYNEGSKIFHVEVDRYWLRQNNLLADKIDADKVNDQRAKNIFLNILNEFEIRDQLSGNSIESLILYLSNVLIRSSGHHNKIPKWVHTFHAIIPDMDTSELSLETLSAILNIHPVTLSREFPKYFNCSFSQYTRQLKIEKSLFFLSKKHLPINEVAHLCGFSEPGNFIRIFKRLKGLTPNAYRSLI